MSQLAFTLGEAKHRFEKNPNSAIICTKNPYTSRVEQKLCGNLKEAKEFFDDYVPPKPKSAPVTETDKKDKVDPDAKNIAEPSDGKVPTKEEIDKATEEAAAEIVGDRELTEEETQADFNKDKEAELKKEDPPKTVEFMSSKDLGLH